MKNLVPVNYTPPATISPEPESKPIPDPEAVLVQTPEPEQITQIVIDPTASTMPTTNTNPEPAGTGFVLSATAKAEIAQIIVIIMASQ